MCVCASERVPRERERERVSRERESREREKESLTSLKRGRESHESRESLKSLKRERGNDSEGARAHWGLTCDLRENIQPSECGCPRHPMATGPLPRTVWRSTAFGVLLLEPPRRRPPLRPLLRRRSKRRRMRRCDLAQSSHATAAAQLKIARRGGLVIATTSTRSNSSSSSSSSSRRRTRVDIDAIVKISNDKHRLRLLTLNHSPKGDLRMHPTVAANRTGTRT